MLGLHRQIRDFRTPRYQRASDRDAVVVAKPGSLVATDAYLPWIANKAYRSVINVADEPDRLIIRFTLT